MEMVIHTACFRLIVELIYLESSPGLSQILTHLLVDDSS